MEGGEAARGAGSGASARAARLVRSYGRCGENSDDAYELRWDLFRGRGPAAQAASYRLVQQWRHGLGPGHSWRRWPTAFVSSLHSDRRREVGACVARGGASSWSAHSLKCFHFVRPVVCFVLLHYLHTMTRPEDQRLTRHRNTYAEMQVFVYDEHPRVAAVILRCVRDRALRNRHTSSQIPGSHSESSLS